MHDILFFHFVRCGCEKVLKMSLVKVSVETTESSDKMLHEIDLSKSVEENVKSICKVFGKVRIFT